MCFIRICPFNLNYQIIMIESFTVSLYYAFNVFKICDDIYFLLKIFIISIFSLFLLYFIYPLYFFKEATLVVLVLFCFLLLSVSVSLNLAFTFIYF